MSKENAQPQAEEQKPASAEVQPDEITEVSETSEAKEGEELEGKDAKEDQADEQKEESDERPKKKSGVEKRIDKLTKQRETERLEKEYWKAQALKSQNPASDQEQEKPESQSAKPKSDDFNSHEEYLEALVDWKAEQKLKIQETKIKESQLKSEYQKQVEEYGAKAKAYAKENPDFDEVVNQADDVSLSITVQSAILKHGPELAYELAKDVEALEEICALPALEAAERIGEIRARMKASKTAAKIEKPKTTQAPKPPNPIAAKSTPVRKSIFDEDLPFAEYVHMRRDQLRKRA